MMTDQTQKSDPTIRHARFVATKFYDDSTPWVYSRDTGDLEHIRYTSDYTGYDRWTKRAARAFAPRHLLGIDSFSRQFRGSRIGIRERLYSAWAHIKVNLSKSTHLPDGQVNGMPTFWEEDGEYMVLMGPTVGVRVLDFLEAEPSNPHAVAILAEMKRVEKISWPNWNG